MTGGKVDQGHQAHRGRFHPFVCLQEIRHPVASLQEIPQCLHPFASLQEIPQRLHPFLSLQEIPQCLRPFASEMVIPCHPHQFGCLSASRFRPPSHPDQLDLMMSMCLTLGMSAWKVL